MSRRFTIPFLQTMRRLLFVYMSGAGLMVVVLLFSGLFRVLLADASGTKLAYTIEATVDLHHPPLFGPIRSFVNDVVAGWGDGIAGKPYGYSRSNFIKPPLLPAPTGKAVYQLVADNERQLLRYQEPSPWKRLLLLHLGVTYSDMSLGLAVYMLVSGILLYRIMRDVTPMTPFTEANANRIRWLGLLLIAADMYQQLVYALLPLLIPPFQQASTNKLLSEYIILTPRVEYGDWGIGLMLLVIAAVYQRGVDITREAELTV